VLVAKRERNPNVKTAREERYQWPAPVSEEDAYVPKEKNPIHSILTALPILMLVAGLYIYYKGESQQRVGRALLPVDRCRRVCSRCQSTGRSDKSTAGSRKGYSSRG